MREIIKIAPFLWWNRELGARGEILTPPKP